MSTGRRKMYEPTPVFPASVEVEIHDPGPGATVELRVVGTPTGHTGLLFSVPGAAWAIDLTISGTFAAMLPVVSDGAATVRNFSVVRYYRPADHGAWSALWRPRGGPTQLTGDMAARVARHVVDVVGPSAARFVLVGQARTPVLSGVARRTSDVFSEPCASDRLPQLVLEWLARQGVEVAPFAVSRLVLSSDEPPTPVPDRDPGLLAWARAVGRHEAALALAGRDVDGAVAALSRLRCSSEAVDPLAYVASLDPVTREQRWWRTAPGAELVTLSGTCDARLARSKWRGKTVVIGSCAAVAILGVLFGALYRHEAMRRRILASVPDLSLVQRLALERAVARK